MGFLKSKNVVLVLYGEFNFIYIKKSEIIINQNSGNINIFSAVMFDLIVHL